MAPCTPRMIVQSVLANLTADGWFFGLYDPDYDAIVVGDFDTDYIEPLTPELSKRNAAQIMKYFTATGPDGEYVVLCYRFDQDENLLDTARIQIVPSADPVDVIAFYTLNVDPHVEKALVHFGIL